MTETPRFVDYYEVLEISPNANSRSVERMFRYLAQRYHPDNPDTGDRLQFDAIMEAFDTLKDSAKRAQYDVEHKNQSRSHKKLADEASNGAGVERNVDIQHKLLSVLFDSGLFTLGRTFSTAC